MFSELKILFQKILPKQIITEIFGFLASRNLGFFTNWMILGFIKLYKIDLSESEIKDPKKFYTFNQFFARNLDENARKIEHIENGLVFPADGKISEFGEILGDKIIQAKGVHYSLEALLVCEEKLINEFRNGSFLTTYLSPKDYHRIHMPCDAILREIIYVPGLLYSVNDNTANRIPNLFAINERVIVVFDTKFGRMIQILVGATIVGSINLEWLGAITPPRKGVMERWSYPNSGERAIEIKKGEQMGFFSLGSTVINLFQHNQIHFDKTVEIGAFAKVGKNFAFFEVTH